MNDAATNLGVLRRWVDAYEAGGIDGTEAVIGEVFDPEVEFSPLLAREIEGRTYHGHDGMREFFRELNDMLGDVRYEPPEYEVVGTDVILLFNRMIGSGRGSTVPVVQDLALVYEFRDGLVIRFTAYGTREEALEAARAAAHA
jgi:ketosteroid isomerase-like protein